MDVQEMRTARHSPAVLLQNYLQNRKNYKVACFFEGETDRYYYFNILDELLKTEFLFIPCYGKDNLIRILHLVENEKSETNSNIELMFFIDGDYKNKTVYAKEKKQYNQDLFILNAYSFENYYCSVTCIKKILIREFGLNANSEILAYLITEYVNISDIAKNSLAILNKCFYIIKEIRKNNYTQINFDTLNAITYNSQANKIEANKLSFFNVAQFYKIEKFNEAEINEAEIFFNNKDLSYYGRGHTQIKLISYFFCYLYKKIKDGKLEFNGKKVKISCKVDFGKEIVEHCAYAAERPNDLIQFISKHIEKDVELN